MTNFTTETQSAQRKPNRGWTGILTLKKKTNRRWTQIYADKSALLRSAQETPASFQPSIVRLFTDLAEEMCALQKSTKAALK